MARLPYKDEIDGASGVSYIFDVFTCDHTFDDVRAVYIFAKKPIPYNELYYEPLYIDWTDALGSTVKNHTKWPCINKHGCTHICVFSVSDIDEEWDEWKKEAVADLIQQHNPPCND